MKYYDHKTALHLLLDEKVRDKLKRILIQYYLNITFSSVIDLIFTQ